MSTLLQASCSKEADGKDEITWSTELPAEFESTIGSNRFGLLDVKGSKDPELILTKGGRVVVMGTRGNVLRRFVSPLDSGIPSLIGDYDGDGKQDFLFGALSGARPELAVINGMGDVIAHPEFPFILHGSSFFLPVHMDAELIYVLAGEKWPYNPRGLYAFERRNMSIRWFFVLPQAPIGVFPYHIPDKTKSDIGELRFLFSLESRDTGVFTRIGTDRMKIEGADSALHLVETDAEGNLLNNSGIGEENISGRAYVIPLAGKDKKVMVRVPLPEEREESDKTYEIYLLSEDGRILAEHTFHKFSFENIRLVHEGGQEYILLLDKHKELQRLSSFDSNLKKRWSIERKERIIISGAGRGIPPLHTGGFDSSTSAGGTRLPAIAIGNRVFFCSGTRTPGETAPEGEASGAALMPGEKPLAVCKEPVEACALYSGEEGFTLYTIAGGTVSRRDLSP